MNPISDDRAKPTDFEIAVQRVTDWLVKRGSETSPAAKAFISDITLILMAAKDSAAAREREQQITLTVNRLHDWLSRNVPSEMRNGDCVDIAIRLLSERAVVQADLIAAREREQGLREAVTGKIGAWMSIQEALAYIATGQGNRGDTLTEWAKDYSARLNQALTGDKPNG